MTGDVSARKLDSLFRPRAIALIGASDRYLPRNLWKSVRASGFAGAVYPVNPGREDVFGTKCYPSVAALPEPVDLCLVAVNERNARCRRCANAPLPARRRRRCSRCSMPPSARVPCAPNS